MHIRDILPRRRGLAPSLGLALLLATALGPAPQAQAQQRRDPLTDLQLALGRFYPEPQTRKSALEKRVDALDNLGDMAQALLLQGWLDDSTVGMDTDAYKFDREVRTGLLNKFEKRFAEVAEKGNEVARAAAATLVGEFAASARSASVSGAGKNLLLIDRLPDFLKPLANLAEKDKADSVRAAAALALAKLRAEPKQTAAALERLLKGADVPVRRAAAAALGDLLRGTPAADRGGIAAVVATPRPEEVISFGQEVARAAAAGLADRDVEVRRLSAAALLRVASEFNSQLNFGYEPDVVHKRLKPLSTALWDQAGAIAKAVNDPDPAVRFSARRTVEEMGQARQRWLNPPLQALPPPKPEKPVRAPGGGVGEVSLVYLPEPAPAAKDDLLPGLLTTVPALIDGLKDPDVRGRLAALDALEAIVTRTGEATTAEEIGEKPATDIGRALVRGLSDPDRFVRWASARGLARLAPLPSVERGAVAGLVRMRDQDPDLQMRAAFVLERFGEAARPAVPALAARAARGDTEARILAIHALGAIGGDADDVVPALAAGLGDSNVRVRRGAADALSRYGAAAKDAQPALERAMRDSDPEVRRLAADALLRINRAP
jgi:HEAT repeat protein